VICAALEVFEFLNGSALVDYLLVVVSGGGLVVLNDYIETRGQVATLQVRRELGVTSPASAAQEGAHREGQ